MSASARFSLEMAAPAQEGVCIDVTNFGDSPVTVHTVSWAVGKGKSGTTAPQGSSRLGEGSRPPLKSGLKSHRRPLADRDKPEQPLLDGLSIA